MKLIFLLFVALPIIEISLFVVLGGMLGLLGTLLEVVLTAALGLYLMGSLNSRNMEAYVQKLDRTSFGSMSAKMSRIFRPVMLFLSGILFLLPGFFTDLMALLLLFPRSELFLLLLFPLLPMDKVATATSEVSETPEKEPVILEGKYRRDDNN